VREVIAVLHLDAEEDRRDLAAVGALQRHVVDVGLGVGDRQRQFGEEPAAVLDQQADACVENAIDVVRAVRRVDSVRRVQRART
jgi:hypothetical protein